MDYSQFLHMREELSLVAVLLLLFLADLFAGPVLNKRTRPFEHHAASYPDGHPWQSVVQAQLPPTFWRYVALYVPMHTVVKSILNIGTLIVFLMAHEWMKRDDTSFKQGEFYVLTLSTLFGMYLMISAGHFLMFFIGLETASIPMAALIAFDKYRHNSAEAGAKYILTALFSSALLLFDLSMIYGSRRTPISMIFLLISMKSVANHNFCILLYRYGVQALSGSVPFMDGRRLRRCTEYGYRLSECYLQRFGSICADGNSDQSIRTDDT